MKTPRHISISLSLLLCLTVGAVALTASIGVLPNAANPESKILSKSLSNQYIEDDKVKIASGASYSRRLRKSGWSLLEKGEEQVAMIRFKIHLRQCNIEKLEEAALAVSDLDSPRYGQHLSSQEVCDLISCPDDAFEVLHNWLRPVKTKFPNSVSTREYCSHIIVIASAKAANAMFPEANFRPHLPPNSNDAPALRATGDVLIPRHIAQHVDFISGLTELWTSKDHPLHERGGYMGKRSAAASGSMEAGNFTQVLIKPRTLRTLYGVPEWERGGWAGKGNNRQGVAAFNDFYLSSDLCAAHNLLAPDVDWLNPPDVTYIGPEFDPIADEAESDLDTQYMAMMGAGVPITFSNHADGQWILDWAQEATEGELTRDKGGPLVWSVSYGFPELWQCSVAEDACQDGVHGYEPTLYLQRANAELAKLAAMGVSVLISSGDDGSPGFGATCPVDPKLPVDVTGGQVGGASNACPFDDMDDCKCASFILETPRNDTSEIDAPLRCILPLGFAAEQFNADTPGADCLEAIQDPDCQALLAGMENGTYYGDFASYAAFGGDSSCKAAFSFENLSFYSDCACADVPTVVEGACSLKGYSFEKTRDGPTAFTPDFPASSPWVTSVGATQIAWDLSGSCLQTDLLSPGNAGSAETAVNKYTGGFDGGGGFSTLFPTPDYQTTHVAGYVESDAAPPKGTYNQTNRGYPDISVAGHNYVVVVGGKVSQVQGTSASAPALAGMISLMNERLLAAGKPPLGFLNPALYKAAAESPEAFQAIVPKTYDLSGTPLEDVVGKTYEVGSNRCTRFSCCEIGYGGAVDGGWDPVTGLGTINYEALANFLKIPAGPPRPPPPGRGHDRHHAAYIAWIVVLVFGFATAVILLVYENRPKLLLSASNLGKSVRRSTSKFGSYGNASNEEDGKWGRSRRRRPRGALTEMVMESEIGLGLEESGASAYRLLDEDDGLDGEGDGQEDGDGKQQQQQQQQQQQSPGRRRV